MREKFSKKSFTIIELVMAIGVFTFVVLSALGIYTTTIQKHYDAQKIQLVVEELRYPMEVMAKDIKEGILMYGDSDELYIASKRMGEDNFKKCLEKDKSRCLVYKIENSQLKAKFPGETNFSPLTSSKIEIIDPSKFYIDAASVGSSNFDKDNPKVTILITARAKNDSKEISKITLQTTVTQNEPQNYFQGAP